ncbi:hypothetical protein E2562_000425 [Oryza meyeriana var. granulata]|uniref:Sm domain-containing protein n=1 Tax=Oryza meyeriana var. granulata TaxID=110450 RepID=A0A6G1CBY1_9ORYZ|nr:hypothetical protein E2562_000425 [Oryza meyeriana var. granulata]
MASLIYKISSDQISGWFGMSGRKETVLDLAKFVDKGVQVKLTGGRQVTGTLKGYDQLLNLVLDEAVEFERGLQGYSGNACIAN